MRMWPVPVDTLCRQHLLGEHVEMHMFAGTITKMVSLDGYIVAGQVDVSKIRLRHELLALELRRRQFKHLSPMDPIPVLAVSPKDVRRSQEIFKANSLVSARDLWSRCPECRARMAQRYPGLYEKCAS